MSNATENITRLKRILTQGTSSALEKLAADLVSKVIELSVRRAGGGAQYGADAGAMTTVQTIRVETKRYQDSTSLRERELLGEIAQAIMRDPFIEAWILVCTRNVKESLSKALRDYGIHHGVPIFIIDWMGMSGNDIGCRHTVHPIQKQMHFLLLPYSLKLLTTDGS